MTLGRSSCVVFCHRWAILVFDNVVKLIIQIIYASQSKETLTEYVELSGI